MIGSRSCKALAAALVGGLSCSILLAVPGKVVTKQGDTFEGEVQDRRADQGVVIITTADGRKVQVKAGNVDRIQPLARPEGAPDEAPGAPPGFDVPPTPAPRPAPAPGSVEADLRNRLAALPKNDVTNRIKLARAALPRREYGVARDCLDQALRLDPRNQEAADLLRTVDAQQRMDQRARPPAPEQNPGANGGAEPRTQPGDRGSAPPPGMIPPLTADDINRIRQREWVRNDKLVKIRFVGDVKRRFVQKKRIAPADFNNRSAIEQAWQIVSEGDDDMRNDVRLTTDPAALHQYRTVVQRAILPTCASAACHGGGQGGGLQLYPRADHEGEAYANFVMLSTHSYSPRPTEPAGAPPPHGPQGRAQGAGQAGAQGGAPAGVPGGEQGGAPDRGSERAPAGAPAGAGAGPAPGTAPGTAPGGDARALPPPQGRAQPRGTAAARPRQYQVLDRDRPADSLLIQYAMPLNLADIPHPPVPGFKPLFRTLKDPKYDQFLRWVRDELSPLQKEYGIQIGQGQQGPQDVTGAPGQPQPPPPPQGGPVNNPPGQRPETGQAQGKGQVQGQGQLPNPSAPQPQPPRRGQ